MIPTKFRLHQQDQQVYALLVGCMPGRSLISTLFPCIELESEYLNPGFYRKSNIDPVNIERRLELHKKRTNCNLSPLSFITVGLVTGREPCL